MAMARRPPRFCSGTTRLHQLAVYQPARQAEGVGGIEVEQRQPEGAGGELGDFQRGELLAGKQLLYKTGVAALGQRDYALGFGNTDAAVLHQGAGEPRQCGQLRCGQHAH